LVDVSPRQTRHPARERVVPVSVARTLCFITNIMLGHMKYLTRSRALQNATSQPGDAVYRGSVCSRGEKGWVSRPNQNKRERAHSGYGPDHDLFVGKTEDEIAKPRVEEQDKQ
jgi:hypothetical protein